MSLISTRVVACTVCLVEMNMAVVVVLLLVILPTSERTSDRHMLKQALQRATLSGAPAKS